MKSTTVQKILLEFESKAENLLPALKKISAVFGYISEKEIDLIANYFSLSSTKVFETASFYDQIKTEKTTQLLIQVCSSANCSVNNSFQLVREIENLFKIKAGDDNLKVSLEEISCLGRCAEGPIMVVNGKIYEKVSKSSVHEILKDYI